MVSLAQLWMPILAAAVFTFVASCLVHMVFKWHAADYKGLPDEEGARAALRAASPGEYLVPYGSDYKDMAKPEMMQKFKDGPIAKLTIRPAGPPTMGAAMGQWFVLNLVIAFAAGYLAAHTLPMGASFLGVSRIVGSVVFLAYACGGLSQAIWMGRPWPSAFRDVLDALLYGLVCAIAFGWLWPR